ncbi:hypothetical protein [Thermoflavimicrobium dichotomicum]|uniref:Uncharacterized protein n=1 Tax=Thermoflavimicrobium dichotomicum TaxID=46223 RepID=A0A1I3NCS1_9BACL|nr:hypothetical protein [Thermoflavimicrobium dichotomicum]SFJ07064.1 hypothetical protein SAMN05421852_10491 [Thermoflavimicrobium dichotomicum]
MEQQRRPFQLLDVQQYPNILDKITKFEQELNQLVQGHTAVIAYIHKETKSEIS